MSTSIQSHSTPDRPYCDQLRPEALQAVQVFQDAVKNWVPESEYTLTATSVEFPVLYGRCTLSVAPISLDTYDGLRLSERLEARIELSDIIDGFDDDFLALANTYATTGAALRCPETDRAILVSGVSVFRDDVEALRTLYTPLLIWSAIAQSFSIQRAMRDTFGTDLLGEKSDELGPPGHDEPTLWRAEEFAHVEAMLSSAGVYCNAGDTGLTAEFAWEPDVVSAMVGDKTSLLQLDNQVTHPTAGNGLAFRLVLPVSGSAEELSTHADRLNQLEAHGIDVPPSFGAWSHARQFGSVAYAGFWPNCMYGAGTAANIATWCYIRSRIARQVIVNQS